MPSPFLSLGEMKPLRAQHFFQAPAQLMGSGDPLGSSTHPQPTSCSASLGHRSEQPDGSDGCLWVEGLQFCLAPIWPHKVQASFRSIPKLMGTELCAADLFLKENRPMET